MATQLQLRRGTTSETGSFTGAVGEVTVDTTKDTLVVHDGSTAGGHEVAKNDGSNMTAIDVGDNVQLKMGGSDDLLIYHDGSNSYISDQGTGSLIIDGSSSTQIKGSSFVILRSSAGENMAVGNADGAFDVYYNGSKKLATTTSGCDITGTATMDGLTVEGGNSGSNVDVASFTSATGALNINCSDLSAANPTWTLRSFSGEPIAFAQGTTEAMRIDGSQNVSIPNGDFKIHPNNSTRGLTITSTTTGTAGDTTIYDTVAAGFGRHVFKTDGTEAMRIDGSQNVSIPNGDLTVGSFAKFHGTSELFLDSGASGTNKSGLRFETNGLLPRKNFAMDTGGNVSLGNATYKFSEVFAVNGTINTSDRNEKQDIESLTEAEERVAVAAKSLLKKFRWKDAVEAKGDDARIHFGIIAQDLQAAFEAEGLDAGRYGMFTSNTWWEHDVEVPAIEAVEGVEGVATVEAQEAVMGERQKMETVETGTYVNLAGETITETQEVGVTEDVVQTVVERQDIDGVMTEVEVEKTVSVPVMESYEVSPAVEAVAGVEAVEAVKAADAYTRTDTYNTAEEAPEGSVEKTRMGVRYSELLAFIISAI